MVGITSLVFGRVAAAFAPQVASVESKPILTAFNDVTTAIANAFDRDAARADFPEASRAVVLENLTKIRSGMLALIRNSGGTHEGKLEDVPGILPDLRAIVAIMKDDQASVIALTRYRQRISPILPVVSASEEKAANQKKRPE